MSPNPSLITQLREIGLFGGLGDHVLQGLADTLELLDLEPGAVAFREGDSGREMFVLLSGEMEVLKRSKRDVEARVAVLGPNDWFGEMSILDVMPRSATVRAIAPSRLLRVTAHDLDTLYRRDLKSYTLLVLNIAREMSRRLRVADSLLAELVANMLDEYARPRRPGI
ncbi:MULTISPECIES: cyclic nucleotide-binding domain-containing protein [Sorangium]|uniref:cAMP-dependent protein kinase regulatory subunit n=1 Tax=Sorangium cellulosum (strain So ce56) TaxID=448385 RepID=A9FMS7_SORC5|nr:cyclic nucleotide-binding domain-containing protein [Sorangium cellulosum]CAN98357.1 cAMP-dependent protein kinase regulatory subunit [Sorangium cellulosum So ce56]